MYSLGDALNELGSSGSIKVKLTEAKALSCWGEVVGETVQKNTCPLKVVNGILFVKTKSPSWAQELKVLDYKIKSKINELAGSVVVKEIRFVCDNSFSKLDDVEMIKTGKLDLESVELSREEESNVSEIVSEIEEDSLKKEMQRLIVMNKKLNKLRDGEINKK